MTKTEIHQRFIARIASELMALHQGHDLLELDECIITGN